MKSIYLAVILGFTAVISGCSTLSDAQAAKGTGEFRVYDKDYDTVWFAVVNAVNASGLDLVSEDKNNGRILAQRGITAFSYGENVAIFVERINGEVRTRVEVVNKRAMATNVMAPNWERRILENLDSRLL